MSDFFVHSVTLHTSPLGSHVIQELGFEGYGRLILLMELASSQYPGFGEYKVCLGRRQLASMLDSGERYLDKILSRFEELGAIKVLLDPLVGSYKESTNPLVGSYKESTNPPSKGLVGGSVATLVLAKSLFVHTKKSASSSSNILSSSKEETNNNNTEEEESEEEEERAPVAPKTSSGQARVTAVFGNIELYQACVQKYGVRIAWDAFEALEEALQSKEIANKASYFQSICKKMSERPRMHPELTEDLRIPLATDTRPESVERRQYYMNLPGYKEWAKLRPREHSDDYCTRIGRPIL